MYFTKRHGENSHCIFLQVELDKVKGDTEKEHLGMAESMPGGLNMGNVETLSSGSSSLDKKKNADRNSIDGYSDEHSTCNCLVAFLFITLCVSVFVFVFARL